MKTKVIIFIALVLAIWSNTFTVWAFYIMGFTGQVIAPDERNIAEFWAASGIMGTLLVALIAHIKNMFRR